MTEKVYEFNELDPKFWVLWTGSGHYNLFEIAEGKFNFESMYVYTPPQSHIILRTSRPYSFVNNAFSIDFAVTEDSYGEIIFSFSPKQADSGIAPYTLSDVDYFCIWITDDFTVAIFERLIGGVAQFRYYKELEKGKRSGTIKVENKQGMVTFYVDDEPIMSAPQTFISGHIYITLRPHSDLHANMRRFKGWIDNFRIQDYETACLNPELASLLPTLNAMTTATLSLTAVLSIIGMLKGVLR